MMWYTAVKGRQPLLRNKRVEASKHERFAFANLFFIYDRSREMFFQIFTVKTWPMPHINIEIKARCTDPDFVRNFLVSHGAEYRGTDHQTDTYFLVSHGRLKLREGNIENNLIYYERDNQAGPKASFFRLVKVEDAAGLKAALTSSCGIKVVVTKKREIYYIGNVKFHIDDVPGLGSFVEIEAGNILADLSREALQSQCDEYMAQLNIRPEDLVELSYSDLMMGGGD